MGLTPGSVTPLGLLNDTECKVHFYLDATFENQKISVHPNDNTSTVWLAADDLMDLIHRHGNAAEYTAL